MAVKLIPNTITVSEQFALRARYDNACNRWYNAQNPPTPHWYQWTPTLLRQLEDESGIRCQAIEHVGQHQLTNYELVNEKQHAWFMLKWS